MHPEVGQVWGWAEEPCTWRLVTRYEDSKDIRCRLFGKNILMRHHQWQEHVSRGMHLIIPLREVTNG